MAYRGDPPSLPPAAVDAGADGRRDLVYENHPAVSGLGVYQPDGHDGPGSLGLLHAAAAVYPAERHSPAVRGSLLLGLGRVLDRADGLPAAAHGA